MERVAVVLKKLTDLYNDQSTKSSIDLDLMLDFTKVLYADLLDWRKNIEKENEVNNTVAFESIVQALNKRKADLESKDEAKAVLTNSNDMAVPSTEIVQESQNTESITDKEVLNSPSEIIEAVSLNEVEEKPTSVLNNSIIEPKVDTKSENETSVSWDLPIEFTMPNMEYSVGNSLNANDLIIDSENLSQQNKATEVASPQKDNNIEKEDIESKNNRIDIKNDTNLFSNIDIEEEKISSFEPTIVLTENIPELEARIIAEEEQHADQLALDSETYHLKNDDPLSQSEDEFEAETSLNTEIEAVNVENQNLTELSQVETVDPQIKEDTPEITEISSEELIKDADDSDDSKDMNTIIDDNSNIVEEPVEENKITESAIIEETTVEDKDNVETEVVKIPEIVLNKDLDDSEDKLQNGALLAPLDTDSELNNSIKKGDLTSEKSPIYSPFSNHLGDIVLKKEVKAIDVKQFIGINDKYQFMNELFDNDKNDYEDTFNHINELGNYEAAKLWIEEIALPVFSWNKQDPTYHELVAIVKKAFSSKQ